MWYIESSREKGKTQLTQKLSPIVFHWEPLKLLFSDTKS
jgi:hypothetical protein